MVNFEDNMCPVLIHGFFCMRSPTHINGFFQMRSSGVPTKVVDNEGKTIEEIYENNLVDNTTHAVFHSLNENMSYNEFQKSLVSHFLLVFD